MGCLLLGLLIPPAAASDPATGLQSSVIFTDESSLSGNAELMRRSFTPLTIWRARRAARRSGVAIRDQPVDLPRERFSLYVPASAPSDGYALIVFVSPSARADVPSRWTPILDHHGMIFVSAQNAGNDASPLGRREPLALAAAESVMKRYAVDPRRVYVSGFSGGSRMALRLAVGYPDLFRGALLIAGSDPLGQTTAIPPRDLFLQFQERTRLVYLTGEHDDFHRNADNASRQSMREFCVFNTDSEITPWTGHDLPDPASFDRALTELEKQTGPDPGQLAQCREALDQEILDGLRHVEQQLSAGQADDARSLLDRVDTRFGGLAAPRSVALAEKIEAGP